MNTFSGTNFQTGVIPAGQTTVTVTCSNLVLPGAAILNSVASGRAINVFPDASSNVQSPPVDMTATGQIVTGIKIPCQAIQFVGAAGDVWTIR